METNFNRKIIPFTFKRICRKNSFPPLMYFVHVTVRSGSRNALILILWPCGTYAALRFPEDSSLCFGA